MNTNTPRRRLSASRAALGSLPVSSAEALLSAYEAHAAGNDRDADVQRRFGTQSLAELYENNAVLDLFKGAATRVVLPAQRVTPETLATLQRLAPQYGGVGRAIDAAALLLANTKVCGERSSPGENHNASPARSQ